MKKRHIKILALTLLVVIAVVFAFAAFAGVKANPQASSLLAGLGGSSMIGYGLIGALAADRNTPRRDGQQVSMGVGTGKKIYAGGLVMRNATGYATPGAAATLGTMIGIGRAAEQQDNTAGADGAINVLVDAYGIYRFANSAAGDQITIADIGLAAYVVDDQTVARTSNNGARCVAGMIYDVDASGVWIDFSYSTYAPAANPRSVVALADAAATLTAAQLITQGIFSITPGAGRALTTDTAALLVAGYPRAKVGDNFTFSIICLAAFAATLTAGANVTLVGNMAANNSSALFMAVFTKIGAGTEAVTIYRL